MFAELQQFEKRKKNARIMWYVSMYCMYVCMYVFNFLCFSHQGGTMDMAVGVLAIQLGLLDDAAKIFREVIHTYIHTYMLFSELLLNVFRLGDMICSIDCTKPRAYGTRYVHTVLPHTDIHTLPVFIGCEYGTKSGSHSS